MNLKTSLFLLFILSIVENGNAQRAIGVGFAPSDTSLQQGSGIPMGIVNSTPDKIVATGSEFLNEKFSEALVNKGSQYFNLRYNNYSGFFEYKKNASEIITLSKESNTEIRFKDGKTYLLKKYKINKVEKTNYLLEVDRSDSNVKIYKLENIEFIPYKEALNNYQEQKLPEYKVKKPVYFVEFQEVITPVEKSKDLEKIFPNHSKEIKKFISQKNIDFNSDDMILVQKFINSIL